MSEHNTTETAPMQPHARKFFERDLQVFRDGGNNILADLLLQLHDRDAWADRAVRVINQQEERIRTLETQVEEFRAWREQMEARSDEGLEPFEQGLVPLPFPAL